MSEQVAAREVHSAPGPRRRSELAAARLPVDPNATAEPLTLCLVASKKDHGPGEHEYPTWQAQWRELLGQAPRVAIRTPFDWPSSDDWRQSQVMIWYFWHHHWSDQDYAELDAHLGRGGGVVAIHAGLVEDRAPQRLAERFGLAGQRPRLQFRHGPAELKATAAAQGSFFHGLPRLELVDETYWDFDGDPGRVNVLATADELGQARPQIWTHEAGPGRVFCTTPGHFLRTFGDPLYRLVLLRGIAWAGRQPLARFEPLAEIGAGLIDD
ncbi:MAG: ThuA domain-containing protein [Pirellulales bacterium]|nr:ThuA domain-containing protein [Pirellulales bacterium]